jgi:hypothetical protein
MLVAHRRPGVIWAMQAVAACILVALVASPRAGAVDLHVRARTNLELSVRNQGWRLVVSGVLRDNINQGLGGRTVYVWIGPGAWAPSGPDAQGRATGAQDRAAPSRDGALAEVGIVTDANGRFTFSEVLDDGTFAVGTTFEGDLDHEPLEVVREITLARRPLSLSLRAPVAAPFRSPLPIAAEARSEGVPVAGLELRLDVPDSPNDYELVADGDGLARALVEGIAESGPAPLGVRFAGDDVFAPAAAEATALLYFEAYFVGLAATLEEQRDYRLLSVEGRLSTEEGPVVGAVLEVAVPSLDVPERVETGANGDFALVVTLADAIDPGEHEAVVTYAPYAPLGDADGELVSGRAPFTIETAPFARLAALAKYIVGALVLVIVTVLAALRVRSEWRARRVSPARPAPPGRAAPRGFVEFSPPPGDGPPSLTRVSGVALDADTGEAIGSGEVVVVPAGGSAEVAGRYPFAADGAWTTPELAPGLYVVRVGAAGYVSNELAVEIPHRGKYAHVEVYLCSVRSWVRYLYQVMTTELRLSEGRPGPWGHLTPRQIEALVVEAFAGFGALPAAAHDGLRSFHETLGAVLRGAAPPEALLRALTGLLEEVYYSERRYGEDMVDVCRQLVDGVKAAARPEASA